MNPNIALSENLALVGVIAPAVATPATYQTAAINTALQGRVVFLVNVGTVAGGGTLDFKIQASATSGGSYADVASTSITQITASNKQAKCEIRAETLQSLGIGPYIKGTAIVGTANVTFDVVALGGVSHYGPNSDNDLATVTSTILN